MYLRFCAINRLMHYCHSFHVKSFYLVLNALVIVSVLKKQPKTHCFVIPVQRMLKDKKFTPPDIKSITLLNVFLLKALGNKIFISYFRKFLQGECSKTTTWKLVAEEKPLTSDDWQKTEFSMGSSHFQTQAWGGDDCQIQSWSFPTN